jgi:hypothetical protein
MRSYLVDLLQRLPALRNQRLIQQQAQVQALQGSSGDDYVTSNEPLSIYIPWGMQ